jgi:hypothetical protein
MTRRLALTILALSALACGKQTFLVAAFVQTPSLPNPTDPNGTIPPLQVLTAYFGTIDTTDPTKIDASKEAPITDATASVAFRHKGTGGTDVDEDRVIKVPAATSPAGTYTVSSKDEPRLTFEVGVPYTLVLQTAGSDGEAFGARFIPPAPADIQQFVSSTCSITLPAGAGTYQAKRCKDGQVSTPLTIDRTDTPAAGQTPPPAFVLVGKIDPQNPTAEPQITYQTVPDSADKLLKYVLSDVDYRKMSFLIPATAFPSQGYYIVSLLVVKQGKVSGNAFLGSTALSGSGAAGILRAQ